MNLIERFNVRWLKGTKSNIRYLVKQNSDIYSSMAQFIRVAVYKEIKFIEERNKK